MLINTKPSLDTKPKFSYTYYVPAMLWALFILLVCLVSPAYIPKIEFRLLSPDKLAHAGLFGLLSMLSVWGSQKNAILTHRVLFITCLLIVVYSVCIELLQMMMRNGRHADIDDIVANTIGVFFTYLFYRIFYRSLNN